MSKAIFTSQILKNTKPVKNSISAINRLSKQFKIYIITARTEEMIKPVKEWLKKYNIDKNIEKIISSSHENKQDICINNNIVFLCDDDLRHVIDNKVNVRVLFSNKKIIKNKDIIITESWEEIENILLKLI